MSVLTSGEFWAFVGVVAGIYTLFTLGLQVQFGLAGLLNFGQVGFMAIGAYTTVLLMEKAGWPYLAATGAAIVLVSVVGGILIVLDGFHHGCAATGDMQLLIDMLEMSANSLITDKCFFSNCFIIITFHNHLQ